MSKIVCFGEVLWDVFPTHKKIGGAPLNVALRLHSFKNDVNIISSVGNDSSGQELKTYIKNQGLSVDYIETNNYETSKVEVSLDAKGSASYTIKYPCAWDYISFNESLLSLVVSSEVFVFGSLVSRNKHSEETLKKLLSKSRFSVFDVNLRAPHYKIERLLSFMKVANFIKFNDEELLEVSRALGAKSTRIEDLILFIAKITNTESICVTKGNKGAILLYDNAFFYNKGYKVTVKDTVGAGDSFLATLIDGLIKKEIPQKVIDKACAVGAIVTKNEGANPKISNNDIEKIIESTPL